jgi:hypothetical protein
MARRTHDETLSIRDGTTMTGFLVVVGGVFVVIVIVALVLGIVFVF